MLVERQMLDHSVSLRKAARLSGMDPSFLSKVLAGKRSPPSDEKVLERLGKCLGLDPMALTVAAGVVPAALKPLLSDPEFLRRVRPSASRTRLPPHAPPEPRPASGRVRSVPKSPELSEDLL